MRIPKPMIDQTSYGGFQVKVALVKQVVPERAAAIVIDDHGFQHEVPLHVQKSKGILPREGEAWYLEKVMNQWLFSSVIAADLETFLQWHLVTVEDIGDGFATVSTTDGKTLRVDTHVQRCGIHPRVGQQWYIDNSIADRYTFAALVQAPPTWKPIPLNSGYVNGGTTGTGGFGGAPEYLVEHSTTTRVYLRGIIRREGGAAFGSSTTETHAFGAMPAELRPTYSVYFDCAFTNSSSNATNLGRLEVNPNGNVTFALPANISTPWVGIADNTFYHLP